MKHITRLIVLLLLASANISQAQCQVFSIKKKSAINLFMEARGSYKTDHRLECLLNAIKKEKRFVEAYWFLAETYIDLKQPANAIRTLETADGLDLPDQGETKSRLAEIYYSQGQYELALKKIQEIEDASYAFKCSKLKKRYEAAIELRSHPVPFEPKNLKNVNTNYDDYFPSVTADGQMISTTVLVPAVSFYTAKDVKHFQEDMFISRWNGEDWDYSKPLSAPLNTQGNEGSQSFSADGRYMFYIQCDNKANIGSCDIYYSIRRGDTWSIPMNIGEPANSRYWESNPVLSASGDRLYFTTNRPGGLGEADIWCADVEIQFDGTLITSNARPLGEPVNTPEFEFAPFIHADNRTLYFASNGHDGLGGNDIFVSTLQDDGTWSQPKNIGFPINTEGDESGFVVNGRGDRAYFASDNIDKNNRGLDIYEITLPHDVRPTNAILYSPGKVYNAATGKPLQAQVEIFDQRTNTGLFKSLSDKADGKFTAMLPAGGSYGLSVTQPGYMFYTAEISNPGDSISVALQPIKSGSTTVLNNLFFDYDSDVILETSHAEIARLVKFMQTNPKLKIIIVGHTDSRGSQQYNLDLSSRRANALRDALIAQGIPADRIASKGMGSSSPIATNDTDEGRALNRRVEAVIQ